MCDGDGELSGVGEISCPTGLNTRGPCLKKRGGGGEGIWDVVDTTHVEEKELTIRGERGEGKKRGGARNKV